MEVVRHVGRFQLIYEPLQGMYRIITEDDEDEVSLWFNWETRNSLMEMSAHRFKGECEIMLLDASFL